MTDTLLNEWVSMFKQYPEVFPNGYFRFLKTNLRESLTKGTFIYRDGVLLTWKRYKRVQDSALVGDYMIEKLITKEPGNGKAQEVMTEFLSSCEANCWLKVSANNARAMAFYTRNGFAIEEGGKGGPIIKMVRPQIKLSSINI